MYLLCHCEPVRRLVWQSVFRILHNVGSLPPKGEPSDIVLKRYQQNRFLLKSEY